MKTKFGEFCGIQASDKIWFRSIALLTIVLSFAAGCSTSRELQISSQPSGADIYINNQYAGSTPLTKTVQWQNKKSSVSVVAEKQDYQSGSSNYGRAQAKAAPNPWHLNFRLPQISMTKTLRIDCNVPQSGIWINKQQMKNTTPASVQLTFTRKNANSPWAGFDVEVYKQNYQYKAANGSLYPYFQTGISETNFPANGELNVDLEPIEYYLGVILRYQLSGEGVGIQSEKVWSQVGEIEKDPPVSAVTKVSDLPPNLPLVETKLSVTTNGDVVYSLPVWEAGINGPRGANLWLQHGNEMSQLTDGNYFDLTPSVSADGKWIYFSSNRSGKFNIWRIQVNGKGGIGQITDSPSSEADYEPVLSPDGKTLAFSSLRSGSKVWQIWFAGPDGSLQTQICEGSQPSWSPDATRLAYVATDPTTGRDNIWVRDADGGNPPDRILQEANCDFHHPVWTPNGASLVYDSDSAVNVMQQPNYDIWAINIDGSGKTQLTVNGSYDADPAVTPDGKLVYFLSNRGVQENGQDNLQIWKLHLFSN